MINLNVLEVVNQGEMDEKIGSEGFSLRCFPKCSSGWKGRF